MKPLLIAALLLLAVGAEGGEPRITMPVPDIGVLIVKDVKDCLDRKGNPKAKICLPEACTDGLVELIAAAEGVLPYLKAEDIYVSNRLYRENEREQMEMDAIEHINDMQKRNSAIARFRDALRKGGR